MKMVLRTFIGITLIGAAAAMAGGMFSSSAVGQEPWRQYSGDYTEVENVLFDLYRSCSFSPGNECDWDRMRQLCHPEAVFFQPPPRGTDAFLPYDLEGFIQFFKDDIEKYDMKTTGFHEQLGRHETTSFGRIAHSYAVYEIRMDPDAPNPLQRGVDSIQLAFHEGRWWISSINTDVEMPGRLIPDSILKGGSGGGE